MAGPGTSGDLKNSEQHSSWVDGGAGLRGARLRSAVGQRPGPVGRRLGLGRADGDGWLRSGIWSGLWAGIWSSFWAGLRSSFWASLRAEVRRAVQSGRLGLSGLPTAVLRARCLRTAGLCSRRGGTGLCPRGGGAGLSPRGGSAGLSPRAGVRRADCACRACRWPCGEAQLAARFRLVPEAARQPPITRRRGRRGSPRRSR